VPLAVGYQSEQRSGHLSLPQACRKSQRPSFLPGRSVQPNPERVRGSRRRGSAAHRQEERPRPPPRPTPAFSFPNNSPPPPVSLCGAPLGEAAPVRMRRGSCGARDPAGGWGGGRFPHGEGAAALYLTAQWLPPVPAQRALGAGPNRSFARPSCVVLNPSYRTAKRPRPPAPRQPQPRAPGPGRGGPAPPSPCAGAERAEERVFSFYY